MNASCSSKGESRNAAHECNLLEVLQRQKVVTSCESIFTKFSTGNVEELEGDEIIRRIDELLHYVLRHSRRFRSVIPMLDCSDKKYPTGLVVVPKKVRRIEGWF